MHASVIVHLPDHTLALIRTNVTSAHSNFRLGIYRVALMIVTEGWSNGICNSGGRRMPNALRR
jgi:hypothetical protein